MILQPEGGSSGEESRQQPFALFGPIVFAPEFFPERLQVTKERNLSRNAGYCEGEDVTDSGSKNRDIHVSGYILEDGLDSLHELGDNDYRYTMVSATWSGEVMLKESEVEGPIGHYPPANSMLWEYRLDLVSTGRDDSKEQTVNSDNGIISTGDE